MGNTIKHCTRSGILVAVGWGLAACGGDSHEVIDDSALGYPNLDAVYAYSSLTPKGLSLVEK